MKAKLICMGTKMPTWVNDGCNQYIKRIPLPDQLTLQELPIIKRQKNQNPAPLIEKEGAKMVSSIPENSYVIALDVRGKTFDSVGLSQFIIDKSRHYPNLTFLIGGPEGLAPQAEAACHFKWSLSDLTLAHPLARLVVVEAIYRSWSIGQGLPYHK